MADAINHPTRPERAPLAARLVAEAVGTFILITAGLATAVLATPYNQNMTIIVSLGFGVAALILIIALGHVSGAHFNPAVTVGLWAAGRFPSRDIAPYALAQVAGAVLAGGLIRLLVDVVPDGVGGADAMDALSIGYEAHSPWGVGIGVAVVAEFLLTAALVATILSATSVKAPPHQAPFTIAIGLTMLIMLIIPFTNGALNPARATGTAVFAHQWALGQLWAWWLATLAGAAVAGALYRLFGPLEDLDKD